MQTDPKHVRWLHAELPGWIQAGLITKEAANALMLHYGPPPPPRRVALTIFSVLGSLLIAGGIILLFAYNWNNLSHMARAVLALAPLVVCQGLGVYSIRLRPTSGAWRESLGAATVLSVAAAVGLIGQTYHVGGDLGGFLFAWAWLSLPVIYVYQSAVAFALYQFIILSWVVWERISGEHPQFYWLLLAASLPYLFLAMRDNLRPGRFKALQWCVALTVTAALGFSLEYTLPGLWLIVYAAWLSFLFMFQANLAMRWRDRPFGIIGGLGIAVLGLMLTYRTPWRDFAEDHWQPGHRSAVMDVLVTLLLLALCGVYWSRLLRNRNWSSFWWGSAFIVFIVGYLLNALTGVFAAQVLANLYVLGLALITIIHGIQLGAMGTVNKGLALFSALLLLRFFDSNLGFAGRGVAFIVVGASFLAANVYFSRRLKKEGR